MKQRAFEAAHGARWQRFAELLDAAESMRGRYQLDGARATEAFIADYRALCRDLSIAKARGYSPGLITHLNGLVIRGHNVVYVRRSVFLKDMLRFVYSGFPRLIRAEAGFVLAAMLAFLGPGLAMGWVVQQQPELIYSVMSPAQVAQLEGMYDPGAEHFGRERGSASDFQMFGVYIWNNISISFQVFATGLLACIGTLFYLVFNGLILGGVSVHLASVGFSGTFFPFVIGHGSFELTAIVLSGAAGLKLGYALLSPGLQSRREALVGAGKVSIRIVFGTTGMLVIAAFVEAFWSSTQWLGADVKYGVGAVLWLAVLYYFLLAGRGRGSVTA